MTDKVRKISAVVPFSREVLIAHGVIEPTPEERAQMEENDRRYAEARATEERMLTKARTQLVAIAQTNPGVQAVLELHRETEDQYCAACTYGEFNDHAAWPCLTIHALADAYGIEMP